MQGVRIVYGMLERRLAVLQQVNSKEVMSFMYNSRNVRVKDDIVLEGESRRECIWGLF
jgi:hypothetical protein